MKGTRGRVALVFVLVASLTCSNLPFAPAAAAPVTAAHPGQPAIPDPVSVAVHPVVGTDVAVPATKTVPPAAPVWPGVGAAVADRTAAPASSGGSAAVRAGNLPVWIGSASPAQVGVQVADQAAVAAAGVKGMLLRVWRADGAATAGSASVSVDYSGFRTAYGADWATRLRMVQLPACALTTPALPQCQTQTPLSTSRNDYTARRVSAQVDLPAAPAASATSAAMAAPSGSQAVVLALAAGPSGPQGTYQATSLSPSATWQANTQTGDFTWTYPIQVPPGLGTLAPKVALSYDSGMVDGQTSGGNGEASWIGDGFDYQPGFVERKYKPCADSQAAGSKTGDLCWGYDNATVLLNGQATELVKDDTTGIWHLRSDNGARVEHLTGAANGANGGEYWRITTTDGTQYTFGLNHPPGWASGKAVTNSTWTEPVYGLNSGDPCHASPGWCTQAWRWNLDLVVDPHGNAETFWYAPETNMYARGYTGTSKGTPTTYTRGGTLTQIEYGQRSSNIYANTPIQVVFHTADRCSSTATICDLPWDLSCTSGACANSTSPSFWTQKELTSIVTQVWNGSAYANVDTYNLRHELKDTGSGSFPLTLDGITHVGSDGTTALPEVTFGYEPLPNRVDTTNLPVFNRNRVSSVSSESGSSISVTYSAAGCTATTEPTPATNATWCFPQWWDGWQPPPAGTTKQPDWFTKYLVTDVKVGDSTGGSPAEVYHYDYQDGGAWHYDDDTGLVKDSYKTWAQWRGFDKVVTTKGAAGGTQTQTTQRYMRGMNGDRTASGGTKTVSVTDSQGTAVADDTGLQGFRRETVTLSGASGSEMSAQVDDMVNTQTAKSVHSWGTVTANQVNTAVSHSRTSLDAGRGVLQTEVDNTYDSAGILTQSLDKGDVANPTPQCTTYSYARNQSAYLLTYPSEVVTTATSCGGSLPTDPHLIMSDQRTSYDGQAFGAAPVAGGGNATTVQKLSTPGPNPAYLTTATNTYDQYGRLLSSTDALNRTTSTTFTPASGGPITQRADKDPAGNTTTTTLDPGRGVATRKVDVNGKSTTLAYDPLGRLVKVWLPGQDPTTANPIEKYTYYTSSKTSGFAVATSTLLPNGTGYTTTYQIYDGQLRPRQTQTPNMSGGTGRVITDTLYDSRGLVAETTNPYYDKTAAPGTGLVTAYDNTAIPGETVNVYDGDGRKTASIFEAYGVEQWRTTTGYGGDRTTVTPPNGAPATTTIDDARGRTAQLCQYRTLPASGACDAASSTSTTYQYYSNGKTAGMTDPAGNHWSYDYDVLGRTVSATDPDTGHTTSTYDNADQLTSTTDSRGQQLSYAYDTLGHKTQQWSGPVGTGTELATWTYNTSGANLEQLASSTSFVNGNAYTTTVTGYNNQYQPTGMTVSIPTSEGLLGGMYTFGTTYNVDGSVATDVLPAAGGLPAETVVHTYDGVNGLPVTTLGATGYVQQSRYDEFGQPLQLAFGTSSSSQWTYQAFTYDLPTKRLSESQVRRDAAPGSYDADIHYTYDNSGNVTSAADTPTSGVNDVQCFQYDTLQRLTQAWAQGSAGCAAMPSASVLGGPSPYWEQYSYDITGNRTADTLTTGSGTVSTTATYPAPGQAQPHTLTGQTVSGPSGTTTNSFTYDPAGNTTARSSGGVNQTLSWDAQGKLASVTDAAHGHNTSYVYDTGGNLLLQHDDATATLYLPGEELALTGTTVTATRYYTHQGTEVAARTPSGLTWLLADPHGTDTISVDTSTQKVSQRRFMPFGAQRSPLPASWPGLKGFVGGTQDTTTGLTNLGAREYDPTTGRFLSADPLIDPNDPQQINGYAYANNNPITDSDPSGKMLVDPGGGGGSSPPLPIFHPFSQPYTYTGWPNWHWFIPQPPPPPTPKQAANVCRDFPDICNTAVNTARSMRNNPVAPDYVTVERTVTKTLSMTVPTYRQVQTGTTRVQITCLAMEFGCIPQVVVVPQYSRVQTGTTTKKYTITVTYGATVSRSGSLFVSIGSGVPQGKPGDPAVTSVRAGYVIAPAHATPSQVDDVVGSWSISSGYNFGHLSIAFSNNWPDTRQWAFEIGYTTSTTTGPTGAGLSYSQLVQTGVVAPW